MNRIDRKFAQLREMKQTALIPFLTVGDPSIAISVEIIHQLELAGADMVELGVPYSDPLADGPVIQSSSQRALQNPINITDCIQVARKARDTGSKLPFILFTYFNPVLQMGLERIFEFMQESDISGIIIPDLPMEEDSEVRALAERYQIYLIPLVAPTSNDRIKTIAAGAAGFVYCVSSLGVTGVRSQFHSGIDEFIATVKEATNLPVVVGFGISNREQVARFEASCDGVVVGSAIVRKIEDVLPLLQSESSRPSGLLQIKEFVRQLKG